jgi:hypothetical protein
MKTLLTIVLASFFALVVRADDKGPVGRYQLLYAVTETTTPTGKIETKAVWKIHTITGQVWQSVEIVAAGFLQLLPLDTFSSLVWQVLDSVFRSSWEPGFPY